VRNKHRPWTEDDDRRLLNLLAKGKSDMMIGLALRRTTGAVSSRATILRALARPRPPTEAAEKQSERD